MDDPRRKIIAELSRSAISFRPIDNLIFLCGGKLRESQTDPPSHLRELIYDCLKARNPDVFNRVCLAEKVFDHLKDDFNHHGLYSNLIDLEKDLANLANLVVIVIESPGAIAELGAFSAIDSIRKKLLVFVREDHFNTGSFIKWGPLKFLQSYNEDVVRPYAWVTEAPSSDVVHPIKCADSVRLICEDIVSASSRSISGADLNKTDDRDQMSLIVGLMDLFICLKRSEIKGFLNELGIEIETHRVRQYLYVLEVLNFVKSWQQFGDTYYFAIHPDSAAVLKLNPRQFGKDQLELKVDVRNYYKDEDERRFRQIRGFREAGS